MIDELDRVGDAGVLGLAAVVVVGVRRVVEHGVLEHGAEADGVPDLRLALPGELDALGVAAALDVEDAVVGPAVLVVADEIPVGVGGERGLAGAGEAEEDRDVRGILAIDVGRTMHREDAHVRQVVVHRVEDRLLHLARVAGADDDDLPLLEALDDRETVLDAVLRGVVDLQVAGVVDDPVRLEAFAVHGVGVDEQRRGEERVPRLLRHDRDLQSIVGIRVGVPVEPVELAPPLEVLDRELLEGREVLRRDRLVDLAPLLMLSWMPGCPRGTCPRDSGPSVRPCRRRGRRWRRGRPRPVASRVRPARESGDFDGSWPSRGRRPGRRKRYCSWGKRPSVENRGGELKDTTLLSAKPRAERSKPP